MGLPGNTNGGENAWPTHARYLVLGLLCLAALLSYIPRTCIGVAETTIRTDLHLEECSFLGVLLRPKDQMSLVMSSFFFAYALCQLPAGWLAHVWGTRRSLTLFALLWSAATGLGALAEDFPWLMLSRLAMGAAQAGLFPASTSSLAQWFPITRRALASGALGSFMSMGGVAAASVTGILLGQGVGWREMLLIYTIPGIVWAIWFFLWFRDDPEEHPAVNSAELALIRMGRETETASFARSHPEPTPWRAIFTSPAMWSICWQQFFRAGGVMFYMTWFATYLQETRGVTVKEAGILNSLPLLGIVIGSPLGGWISDWVLVRTGSRRVGRQGIAILSQVGGALFLAVASPVGPAWPAGLLFGVSALIAGFGGSCAYSITIDMGGRHVPTVFSMMNMAGNLGAMVFPLLIPPLVRLADWNAVLVVFIAIYLVSALCWLSLNPEGTIFDRTEAKTTRGMTP
jgi:MFS family permease